MNTVHYLEKRVVPRSLSGAKIEDACDVICAEGQRLMNIENIKHLGSNNMASESEEMVVATVASLCDQVKTTTKAKTLSVSSISHRLNETTSSSSKTSNVNRALHLLAYERGWMLIDNSNIDVNWHLSRDGVHLNRSCVKALERNLSKHFGKTLKGEESRDTITEEPQTYADAVKSQGKVKNPLHNQGNNQSQRPGQRHDQSQQRKGNRHDLKQNQRRTQRNHQIWNQVEVA